MAAQWKSKSKSLSFADSSGFVTKKRRLGDDSDIRKAGSNDTSSLIFLFLKRPCRDIASPFPLF